jgi:dephospho-CoA kinase
MAPGGKVDRSAVAGRAFGDERERAWLEGVIWPLVGERITAWLEQARTKRPAPRATVIEVPLLFEAGMEGMYDATIAVVSSEELRVARAAGRGHALADERAARQLPQQEKANRATFVVRNDGTPEDLRRALSSVLDKLGA